MTQDEEKELREELVFIKRLVGYQDGKIELLIGQIQTLQAEKGQMLQLLNASAAKLKELEAAANDRPQNPLRSMNRG